MNNVRVLCVENHCEYLDALKNMLETAGYEVLSATTGRQALSMLEKRPIHACSWNTTCTTRRGRRASGDETNQARDPGALVWGAGSQTPFLL